MKAELKPRLLRLGLIICSVFIYFGNFESRKHTSELSDKYDVRSGGRHMHLR